MERGLKFNKAIVLSIAVLISLICSIPFSAACSASFSETQESIFSADVSSTAIDKAVLTKSVVHHKLKNVKNSFVGFIKLPVQKLSISNRLSEHCISHKKLSYLFENKHTLLILYLQTLL